MQKQTRTVITSSGSYSPENRVLNEAFLQHHFFDQQGKELEKSNTEIIQKFEEITTITERRYVSSEYCTSDVAFFAAQNAIASSCIDPETLDYILVAHNFGDVSKENKQSDMVPSLASRVKQKLGVKNPNCVAYDLIFGCPGWLQAVIQANYIIQSGDANRILVIGAEVMSRISDPNDRDSMLYSDGAGAIILEGSQQDDFIGILGHKTRSDAVDYADMLSMDKSNAVNTTNDPELYLKMKGHQLYKYALERVPEAIKACLDEQQISIHQVHKILIHQANGKMNEAILNRLCQLYSIDKSPVNIMPMIISWSGNSSVATLPTLYDLIVKDQLEGHSIHSRDILVFASVGAGMNISTMIYQVP